MASIEKSGRKKDKGKRSAKKTKVQAIAIENPEPSPVAPQSDTPQDDHKPGSVISIKEASVKADTLTQNGEGSRHPSAAGQHPGPSRPSSALRPGGSVVPPRPSSALSAAPSWTAGMDDQPTTSGSTVSVRSGIKDTKHPSEDMSIVSRPGSRNSVKSVAPVPGMVDIDLNPKEENKHSMLPPDFNEAHAYIPYTYARDSIVRMMEDMKGMKNKHTTVINEIESNYKNIEKETQNQFNTFVISLRDQYGRKVKTFRQVVEVHRAELSQKQDHWDRGLESLSEKNKQLLDDKKKLLIHNKEEYDRFEKEKEDANKDLMHRLDQAEGENHRLKQELEELKARPPEVVPAPVIVAEKQQEAKAEVKVEEKPPTPVKREPTVVVTDMSQPERKEMKEERKNIERERTEINQERDNFDKEREKFNEERKKFMEDKVVLQGDLNTANKDKENWKAKYDDLKDQIDKNNDWKKEYDNLKAQFDAMSAVAKDGDKKKVEENLTKAEQDRDLLQEEKSNLEKDIKKWEDDFKEEYKREPTQAEKPETVKELEKSAEEADEAVKKLDNQIVVLDTLSKGEAPKAPEVQKETLIVKETEVKIVEVRVPDPEVIAQLEMTQAELEAMRKQIMAMKKDKTKLKSEITDLKNKNSDLHGNNNKLDAENKELQRRLNELMGRPKTPKGVDPAELAELQRQLREKDKEMRDQELQFKDDLRDKEKMRKAMEKDLIKALKALQKEKKKRKGGGGGDGLGDYWKRILQIVATEVQDVHNETPKASELIDKKLKDAENEKLQAQDKEQSAESDLQNYEVQVPEGERENDPEYAKLKEALEEAKKESQNAEETVTAIALVQTGVVEEHEEEIKVKKEKKKPVVTEEVTEEVEELENNITNLEEQITEFEDTVTTLESTRDFLKNNNKDLKDKIKDLEDEIARLRAQVDELKERENQLQEDLHTQQEAYEVQLKEKDREHEKRIEEKEAEFQETKKDMETDIKKLLKKIDKLMKKMAKMEKPAVVEGAETEELEKAQQEVETMEEKVTDLEDKVVDLEAEKDDLNTANEKLEARIEELEEIVTVTEERVVTLVAKAKATESAEQDLEEQKDDLAALRKKVQELEESLREKEKEMGEMKLEHDKEIRDKEREKKEMKVDIEKLCKVIDRLKKKLKNKEEQILVGAGEEPDDDQIAAKEEREQREVMERKVSDLETEKEGLLETNRELEETIETVTTEVTTIRKRLVDLEAMAGAQEQLNNANDELNMLKKKIKELENDLREQEKELQQKDIEIRNQKNEHDRQMREKEKTEREMQSDLKKLLKQMGKMKKKLQMREEYIRSLPGGLPPLKESSDEEEGLEAEITDLETKVAQLENKLIDADGEKSTLNNDNEALRATIDRLEKRISSLEKDLDEERQKPARKISTVSATQAVPVRAPAGGGAQSGVDVDLEDLTSQIDMLQKQVDSGENELREERASHEITREELESMRRQLMAVKTEMDRLKHEADAALDKSTSTKDAQIKTLQKKLAGLENQVSTLEEAKMKNLPADAAKEVQTMKNKLKENEKENHDLEMKNAHLSAEVREMKAKLKLHDQSNKKHQGFSSQTEIKLKELRQIKDQEIKRIQAQADRKESERASTERKKIAALEQKIRDLEIHGGGGGGKPARGQADNKATQQLHEKLAATNKEKAELNSKVKQLEKDLKTAERSGGGGGNAGELDRQVKKLEKLNTELMKKIDDLKKRNAKNEESSKKKDDDVKNLEKQYKEKEREVERLKGELSALGVAAKEGVEAAQKAKTLEKEVKKMKEDNKTLNDNFNSERVLRKKYYNMVEDMKGKIRVYCRVRPMSNSELERGNHQVCKSPDEYSISLDSNRGMKEFQFDQIFMPESSQEKVFEDTNNLIQSAVDGYNVCIFAYGQTGSGKTFTIIGDRSQTLPGIAPRAFNRIFELLDENKSKFKYKVECYMLELYNDKLLDLFAKPGTSSDEKLEIKKDKKGMVVILGSEIKQARNSKELYALFDEGSKSRHTASTKMNSESSRSHLVIGIVIETTNRGTGQVLRGKLSLVDLAGSERAAKTEASAEQLKEAMSINKSLSALGDVISALSSEQQFIPYRNNKLTMLMQDSLGGNAKTLMFVNISPADYNVDESVISLTYASRVKLITNDAQKNADNKEINRLKSIISKMKTGAAIEEEEL